MDVAGRFACRQQELAESCKSEVEVIARGLAQAQGRLQVLQNEADQASCPLYQSNGCMLRPRYGYAALFQQHAAMELQDMKVELASAQNCYNLLLMPKQWSRDTVGPPYQDEEEVSEDQEGDWQKINPDAAQHKQAVGSSEPQVGKNKKAADLCR
eukprot:scaffold40954_cov18-Tisochrysis_lutea.AAC.2